MSSERITGSQEKLKAHEALEKAGLTERERLQHELERKAEQSPESNVEKATHEALERAASRLEVEQQSKEQERTSSPAERRVGPSTKEREASFKATMSEVQSEMSAPSRTFSKIIHNKAIEKVSETTGNTIARPNAILSGAIFAFSLTLAVYLVAKNYGYPLSGFETIGAFILGWILGIGYDFVKVMVTGRK